MELRTKRLLLRPLCAEDALGLQRGLNNFNVVQFLARVPYPYTLHMAEEFISRQTAQNEDFVRAISFACAPDEIIGVIAYEQGTEGAFEFGYWLRECCWGMGIMPEAAQAVVQYYFAHGPGGALLSGYWNPASGRILRQLGFIETGEAKIHAAALGKEVTLTRMALYADCA